MLLKAIKIVMPEIERDVNDKLKEFEKNFNLPPEQKFLELCFCILVANNAVEKTHETWKKIGAKFLYLSEDELGNALKNAGYRFYNVRAKYIVEARWVIDKIDFIIRLSNPREWLVKHVKGIGWKEASHFLRNLGFKDYAILDRHVLKLLKQHKPVDFVTSSLTKKIYLEIEEKLRGISNMLGITLAELDLYLFYLDTKKICIR